MKIKEAKTYSYYFIIYDNYDNPKIGGIIASGKQGIYTTKYLNSDKDILIFYQEKEAKKWIKDHTYKGSTFNFIIKKIENNKIWEIVA